MNQPLKGVRSFEERLSAARAEGRKAGIEEAYAILSEATKRIVRHGDDPCDVLTQADKDLSARYHGKATTTVALTPTESATDAANRLTAAAESVSESGDLGDQIVALMDGERRDTAERPFIQRPGASASPSSGAGDLGDQIVALRQQERSFIHQSAARSEQKGQQ